MNLFLDLFSGLGGASEAFIQDQENWVVLRIDNNPLLSGVPNTMIQNINDLPPSTATNGQITCIWASPPCREFSNAYHSPKSKHTRKHGLESYQPDMSLLESALDIIENTQPKYWIIENVIGSIRYFEEVLGPPRQIIGPYVLWGNFPYLEVDASQLQSKASKDVHSSNPLRANFRAKVDYAISQALKDAIERQTSILDY